MFPFGFGYGWYYDPTYVLVILAAVIALAASGYCSSVMRKYSRVGLFSRVTGGQTVQEVRRESTMWDCIPFPEAEVPFTGMTRPFICPQIC